MEFQVREMKPTDWSKVQTIYKQGIDIGNATFQTVVPTYVEWDNTHLNICRYVVINNGIVAGFVALSAVSSRTAFDGVAEVSIYIDNEYKGMGAGQMLLNHIISMSENEGIYSLLSVIIQENKPSISLHEKCGFREVGYREKIAKDINGEWKNTVIMEKRSKLI